MPPTNHDTSEDSNKEAGGVGRSDQTTSKIVTSVSEVDDVSPGGQGISVPQEILGRLSKAASAEIARAIAECFDYTMMSLKPYIVTFIVTV